MNLIKLYQEETIKSTLLINYLISHLSQQIYNLSIINTYANSYLLIYAMHLKKHILLSRNIYNYFNILNILIDLFS